MPYNQNIAYLRKMIADAFDLSVNEFSLFANQKPVTAEDNETLVREVGFYSHVYVIKKTPGASSEQHPKNLLVGNQAFFNLMFELLAHDKEFDVENIWRLLMKLPQDEVPTAKRIESLELAAEDSWDDLIDGSSLHKLLYSLQIVNKLLQAESDWQNSFLVMRGFHHLFHTFLQIEPSRVDSHLAFKSVDLLCKILCESMEKNPDLMNYFKERNLDAAAKIIRLVHEVTNMSLVELEKRGESYDDLYFKNKQSEQKNYRLMSYYGEKAKSDQDEEQNQYSRQVQALSTKFELVGKFISLCFKMLFYFDAYNSEECIEKFIEYSDMKDLLYKVLLQTDNFYIRNQFTDGLGDLL